MTAQLESLSPVVDATPGEVAPGRIRLTNDAATSVRFSVQVVGLSSAVGGPGALAGSQSGVFTVDVDAGATVDCDIPVPIPIDIAVGQHAAAFQASSSRPGDRPVLAPFTVSVESVDKVRLTVEPTPIRGRRRAKFLVGISNDEPTPVAFTLDAEATDVKVKFKTSAFRLVPGQRAATKARLRGPRHLFGEVIQHNLVIAARGKASASTITTPYVQRPVFAHKLRALTAGLAVIALWLAAIGGVALWVSNRNDDAATEQALEAENAALVRLVDANGDILANGPYVALADGTIVDSDGGVVDGFSVDANGNVVDDKGNPINGVFVDPETGELVDADGTPIGLPTGSGDGGDGDGNGSGGDQTAVGADGTGGDSGSDEPVQGIVAPTTTQFRGTVSAAGTDDLSDVVITLLPIDLGEEPRPDATVLDAPGQAPGQGGVPDGTSASKMWSARFVPLTNSLGPLRQTEPAPPLEAIAGVDGVWLLSDVALRQTYELSFAKAGFDTQAFVISPPDDGTPVELDVSLEPSNGLISGRVLDNGSPLGGVEVAISDGTLTFTTTSSTDGDVGSFAFEAVSTPGVYTLTATRDGYGTEVLQLPMDAGQQRDDVVVDMQDGVATLSGTIVNESGTRLGGVTVTASNGEITRTTNSLTDGNRGFYSLPQLDVPGTYTVTVSLDGYLPQTRRVPLGGSLGGVDFALVNTTSTLTGIVSSAGGGGIVGALVTLSNADLEFETSTAAESRPGSFQVADLPPGTYTVTIEHFEHETVTELIEIAEGVNPPLLEVTLPIRTRGIDAGFGSLVVEVVDPGAEDAAEREIRGATVTLVTTLTGETLVSRTDPDSFTFEFTQIPVGTYTINVSAPLYNDAAPRTVSIGQSQERRTIEMLAFGAASGSMVDSITGEVIRGYTVRFFEQDPLGGGEREIGPAEVNVASSSTDGSWATAPRVLPTGTYRLEVSGAAGYREPATQILTPGLPPMQFTVELNSGEATEIPTLVADRYPDIFGRVYEPVLIGGPAAPATGTDFVAIDEPTLQAAMSCNGGPQVPMTMGDEFGTTSGTDLDAFSLTRQAVDANELIGDCEVEITADGYVTATVDLPGVAPTDGDVFPDRVVTTALVHPVDELGGRVFWIDPRNAPSELPLAGVQIFSDSAITSITSTDTTPTPPGPEPSTSSTRIETTSDAAGRWALDDQIFGGARYTFRQFGFQDGLVDVVIDQDQNRVVSEVSGVDVSGPGDDLAVQLVPPNDGSVSGEVSILTIDRPPSFTDVGITAENPFGQTASDLPASAQCQAADSGLCIERNASNFIIDQAAPGTWRVDFTPPDNHVLFGSASARVEQLVGPQEAKVGFNTTYVELGSLDVDLFDVSASNPAPTRVTSNVTLTLSPTSGPAVAPIVACFGTAVHPVTGAACDPHPINGDPYTIDGIPVDLSAPEAVAAFYSLNAVVAGYDQTTAVVTVSAPLPSPTTQSQIGSRSIPVGFYAGSKPTVNVDLLPFGKIEVDVRGEIEPCVQPAPPPSYQDCSATSYEELRIVPTDPGDPALDVTVEYVDINGNPAPVDAGLIGVTQADDHIEILGPEGYYRILVSHPEYQPNVLQRPQKTNNGGIGCTRFCSPSFVEGVYQLANDNPSNDLAGAFTLELRRSTFELSVFETLDAAAPAVGGVTYRLTRTDDNVVAHTGTLAAGDNSIIVADVLPRPTPYRLDVEKAGHFTAITNIVVGRSNTDSAATNPTRVVVTAPLPAVGASVEGNLVVRNEDGGPAPVPAAGFTLATDFDEPQILVDDDGDGSGTLQDNDNAAGDNAAAAQTGGGSSIPFSVTGLASGDHDLTFEVPNGYTPNFGDTNGTPGPGFTVVEELLTNNEAKDFGDLSYTVADVDTVTLSVTGANAAEIFPNLRVLLLPPGVSASPLPAASAGYDGTLVSGNADDNPTPVTVTWTSIAPDTRAYTLVIVDDLHTFTPRSVFIPVVPPAIPPAAGGTTHALASATPTAADGRVRGTTQRVVGNDTEDIDNATTITIFQGGTALSPQPAIERDGATYHVDLPAGGYAVEMSQPGYSTDRKTFTISPGRAIDQNLSINQEVTLTINVTPFAPADLVVQAVPTNGNPIAATRVTPGGTTFTVDVPPGSYVARATDTDFESPVVSSTVTLTTAGDTVTLDIPRMLTVDVVDSAGNTTRTVRVFQGTTQVARIQQSGSNKTFEFVQMADGATLNPNNNQIPRTGSFTVLVEGANRLTVDDATVLDTLQPDITVTLLPEVDLSGTIFAADGTTPITSRPVVDLVVKAGSPTPQEGPGSSPPDTDRANNSGVYEFDNLSNASDGSAVTFVLSTSVPGQGAASEEIVVSGTSTTPATQNLTLAPRDITVTFTVLDDETSAPLSGAQVTFGGQTLTTDSNGLAEFTVPENTARGYTVTASPYLSDTGTIDEVTAYPASLTETVDMVPETVTVTFTASGVASTATQPSVTFNGSTEQMTAGSASFTVNKTLSTPQTWTMTSPAYGTQSGSIASFAADSTVNQALTLKPITGVVSNAGGTVASAGIVYCLLSDPVVACPAGPAVATTDTDGVFSFAHPGDGGSPGTPTTYQLEASGGGEAGTVTFVVGGDLTVTPTSVDVLIA
ncbi:carboxypeptidase regulatory-like domain-containing protein [Ilumatobacter coccineus]|uniref:alpha-amylase n=1 Tax=Ilumatobacter coccineus (strain NBRC 103263 / KCTC 29153 / YM16-304) TaxID=1313172 RepID=A0A6C7E883_ILUCY|nr:carboxypeptidase regulatory-like domain-containing protein [Ilumatobacter coccineus]BAN02630.1 hypothetical protein YM304_23160 [Ilumatobacter coccineus YM16-304]